MIPAGTLQIETAQVNPPKPIGCHVVVDGRTVAIVTLEDLKAAAKQVADLEAANGRL